MRKLTKKENHIMNLFWDHGKMFIRDLITHYPEPKPHFNTVSTQVRTLEELKDLIAKIENGNLPSE